MSDSFDRLIGRTIRRTADQSAHCPEPDLLAAYLDGTLTALERTGVERHAADCPRCALTIAAVVRIEDESREVRQRHARSWWPHLTWIVPASAAAIVAALYVATPSRLSTTPEPRVERAAETAPAPDDKAEGAAAPAELQRVAPSVAAKPDARARVPQRRSTPRTSEPIPPSAMAKTAPAEGAMPTAANEGLRRADADQIGVGGTMQQRAPAAPETAAAEESTAESAQESKVNRARAFDAAVKQQAALTLLAPGGRVQYRVLGSAIERTSDGALTWTRDYAAAPEDLTMGRAVSEDACWLASASGHVLRRADAGSWIDVSPSPSVRIMRFDAATSRDATLVGFDGSVLHTDDGGRSWVPR
jgi:putative zinc finger protein